MVKARAVGTSGPSPPTSGRSIRATLEVRIRPCARLRVFDDDRNGCMALADVARPIGFSQDHQGVGTSSLMFSGLTSTYAQRRRCGAGDSAHPQCNVNSAACPLFIRHCGSAQRYRQDKRARLMRAVRYAWQLGGAKPADDGDQALQCSTVRRVVGAAR